MRPMRVNSSLSCHEAPPPGPAVTSKISQELALGLAERGNWGRRCLYTKSVPTSRAKLVPSPADCLLNVTGAAAGGVAAVCACDAAFDASMADSLVAGWLTEVGLQAVIGTFREVSPCCSLTLGSDLLTITHRKRAH